MRITRNDLEIRIFDINRAWGTNLFVEKQNPGDGATYYLVDLNDSRRIVLRARNQREIYLFLLGMLHAIRES